MEKYQCSGVDWSVYIKGNGFPLLFLHGFPFDHTLYLPAADELTDICRVIIPDLPGFGESRFSPEKAPSIFTMEDYADGLAELLTQMGEKQAVVCGLSMGGYIAMQFLRRHPVFLSGLIFCDTRPIPDTLAARENRLRLAETIFQSGTDSLAEKMIPNLLSPETIAKHPEKTEFLSQMIKRQDPSGIAAAARGMAARDDSTEYLRRAAVPAMALGGTYDKISPPEAIRELAALIPGASYKPIPASGHLPPLEEPALFAAAVRLFLKGIF